MYTTQQLSSVQTISQHDTKVHQRVSTLEQIGTPLAYFQPIITRDTSEINYEALGRMRSGERTIFPDHFLPKLAQCGLTTEFDIAILRNTLMQVLEWSITAHPRRVHVHVNAGTETLSSSLYIATLEFLLRAYNIDPSTITVEILEDCEFWKLPRVMHNLKRIRAMGVHLAIDDFPNVSDPEGLLGWIKRQELDVHTLKLDRSLIRSICDNSSEQSWYDAERYINIAHTYDMQVVAEGVENDAEIGIMKSLQVDALQGYGIGKPMPAHEVLHLSQDWMVVAH